MASADPFSDLFTDPAGDPSAWASWVQRACTWVGAAGGMVLAAQQDGHWSVLATFPQSKESPAWTRGLSEEWFQAVDEAGQRHTIAGPPRSVVHAMAPLAGLRLAFWVPDSFPQAARAEDRVRAAALALRSAIQSGRMAAAEAAVDADQMAWAAFNAINQEDHLERAGMALCGVLATELKAERVAVCAFERGRSRFIALNHSESARKNGRFVRDLEAACDECADQGVPVMVPTPPTLPVVSRLAGEYAHRYGARAGLWLPMRNERGEVSAVVSVEFATHEQMDAPTLRRLHRMQDACGPRLSRLVREAAPWPIRMLNRLHRAGVWAVGPRHTVWKLAGVATVGLVLAGLFMPWSYSLRVPFTVKAEQRYDITAPFDGRIISASAHRHDTVAKDAELLRLDTSDLVVEAAELRAKWAERRLQGDQARQAGKSADAALASAQADQISAELALVEQRIRLAAIQAPARGILLGQEPSERLGATLRKGEKILELVSPSGLYLELDIPGDRLDEVRDAMALDGGLTGSIACEARPDERLDCRAIRMAPVVELEENHPVARLRAGIDGQADWVLPGVEGMARLDLGRRPVGWVLLRSTIRWVRMKLWI